MKVTKLYKYLLMVMACCFFTSNALSAVCDMGDLEVTHVYQYDDGYIFISFDKDIGCGCSVANRVGFHKSANQDYFMSMALTALTTGKKVYFRADNACAIHGNTPSLMAFMIVKE